MKNPNVKFFLLVVIVGFVIKVVLDILPLEKTGITHIEWIVYVILGLITIPFIYRYFKRQEVTEKEESESN